MLFLLQNEKRQRKMKNKQKKNIIYFLFCSFIGKHMNLLKMDKN